MDRYNMRSDSQAKHGANPSQMVTSIVYCVCICHTAICAEGMYGLSNR